MTNPFLGGPKPLIVDGVPVMFRGRPVYEIAGGSETKTETEARSAEDKKLAELLPEDLRQLQGRTPDELKDMLTLIEAHIRSIHQGEGGEIRELSDAERTAMDLAIDIRGKIIDRLDEHAKVQDVFRRRPQAVQQAMTNIRHDISDEGDAVFRLRHHEARDRALRKLEDRTDTMHMSDDEKEQVSRLVRTDPQIARRVIVTENEHYRSAWMKSMTRANPNLNPDEQRAIERWEEFRAMSENTTTAGGFGIPVFIDPSIILTAQGSGNPFLSIAKQVTISTNIWKGVTSAGVSWTFQTEAAVTTDASPTLAQPSVTVHAARGFIPYSIEIGSDYPGFASEMAGLLAEGYDEILVDKFTRGSGTNEPKGILTAISATAGSRVKVTTGGTIGAPDPYNVWKALPQRFRRNASWLMSVGVNNAFRQLGTANVYHAATVALPANWTDALFGKGVYESPYMPDTTTFTTTAEVQAIVGDFSNFLVVRNGGMTTEYIPHLFQQAVAGTGIGFPTGQRGIFAMARIGSDAINPGAFRALVANT